MITHQIDTDVADNSCFQFLINGIIRSLNVCSRLSLNYIVNNRPTIYNQNLEPNPTGNILLTRAVSYNLSVRRFHGFLILAVYCRFENRGQTFQSVLLRRLPKPIATLQWDPWSDSLFVVIEPELQHPSGQHCQQGQWVTEVEHSSFSPLVFSLTWLRKQMSFTRGWPPYSVRSWINPII